VTLVGLGDLILGEVRLGHGVVTLDGCNHKNFDILICTGYPILA